MCVQSDNIFIAFIENVNFTCKILSLKWRVNVDFYQMKWLTFSDVCRSHCLHSHVPCESHTQLAEGKLILFIPFPQPASLFSTLPERHALAQARHLSHTSHLITNLANFVLNNFVPSILTSLRLCGSAILNFLQEVLQVLSCSSISRCITAAWSDTLFPPLLLDHFSFSRSHFCSGT